MDETTEEPAARVLVIVVTHNGAAWLPDCLASLAEQTHPIDTIVIDNLSDEPADVAVREHLPTSEIIRLESNFGFGVAANHALEASQNAPTAEHFLFMHDDVVLAPDAVELLVDAARATGAGIVGGKGLDYDNPDVLVEIGMTADQFGYPFSGLEEGEIDQGQHDVRRETLWVSSACMLVARDLIEKAGLWDGAYFAFGEDLDLCIRARISGHRVIVEPGASYRHAVALAMQKRDCAAAREIRYYTRRNRPRTIAKNVTTYRLPWVLAAYTFLAVTEMVLLMGLRRFEDLSAYPRAFASFMSSLPEVLRRRHAIQKRRVAPDRRLRKFMVKDVHRARVFLERRLQQWERGTLEFGSQALSRLTPQALRATFGRWIRRRATLSMIAVVLMTAVALHKTLLGPPIASGSLLPFPVPVGDLMTRFFSGWREVGVGTQSAAPAAFPLLWIVSALSIFKPVLAEKAVIVVAVALGAWGMYRLTSQRSTSVLARVGATAVYLLGWGPGSIAGSSDLGALASFAVLPFALEVALRMLDPVPGGEGERPSTPRTLDSMSRDVARLALLLAAMTALGPSSITAITLLFLGLGVFSLVGSWDRRDTLRRWGWLMLSIPASLVVLVPWSLEGLRPWGPILAPIFSRPTGVYAPAWRVDPLTFLGNTSGAIQFAAGMTVAIVIAALIVPGASKRREARRMTAMWLFFAVVGLVVVRGWLPTPTASPRMWMAVPVLCFAVLAGHAFSGVVEELPRHALGLRHVFVAALGAVVAAGAWTSVVASIASWPRTPDTYAAPTNDDSKTISSYLTSTAAQVGSFRVLWLGERWVDPVRPFSRRIDGTPYLITGPQGLTMLDAFEGSPDEGINRLDGSVQALAGRRVHLAGHLLAPASIRFIIVDPNDDGLMSAMRRQRDIALEQQQTHSAIFRNLEWFPRAALIAAGGAGGGKAIDKDPSDVTLMLSDLPSGKDVPASGESDFAAPLPRTRHTRLLLSESFNSGWRASVGSKRLEHERTLGWINGFDIPENAKGRLVIRFNRDWIRWLWVLLETLIVAITVTIARSRRREVKGWLR